MAAAQHVDLTTLGTAVSAVPQLRSMCSTVLSTEAPGSGLRVLRLVNKQMRSAMLGAVQGFTLQLDGKAVNLVKEICLLKNTSMSHLQVAVTAHIDGLFGWTPHAEHLHLFLCGMGPALHSVTHLCIHAPLIRPSIEADMLQQLAAACPAIRQLQVTGNVGREYLSAFGAACPNLSRLHLINGVSPLNVQNLHLTLPGLTNVKYQAPPSYNTFSFDQPRAGPYCLALASCVTLTSLDVGFYSLTSDLWHALPSGLTELCCALLRQPISGLRALHKLTHFGCYCQLFGNHAEGPSLAAVLHAAPGLQSLCLIGRSWGDLSKYIPSVAFDCSPSSRPALIYLHERVLAGLLVASTVDNVIVFQGLYLTFWHKTPPGPNREAATFLASLPVLSAVSGLVLDVFEANEWFYGHHSEPLVTSFIPVKFPQLTHLIVSHGDNIGLVNPEGFVGCKGLAYLCIRFGQVTPWQLGKLCSGLKHLKVVELVACEFSVRQGEAFRIQLARCGIHNIKVIVSL